MRSQIWLLGLALVACSDDNEGPVDPEIDGGRPDASLDASQDAGDGGNDGGLDCSPLDSTYKFSLEGGLAPLRYVYTISGAGSVKLERLPGAAFMDAGTFACNGTLGACGTNALDVSDFSAALRNVSSVWGDGSTVYGEDARVYDGQVLVVERTSDNKKIVVGIPCNTQQPCTNAPANIAQLRTVFDRLRSEIALGEQADGGLAGSCNQ